MALMNSSLKYIFISFSYLILIAVQFAHASEQNSPTKLREALHRDIEDHHILDYTSKTNNDWFDSENLDVWESLLYTDSACHDMGLNEGCGYVKLFYLGEYRHYSKANRGTGGNGSWEREHIWPKSRGFPRRKQAGYTDLHHLRPADRNINSAKSNFGFAEGGDPVFDKDEYGTFINSGAKRNSDNHTFEPPDHSKGAVSRMIFYMAIRYEEADLFQDEKTPDLILIKGNVRTKEPFIGDLCTLLNWNDKYPISDFESRRNNRIEEIQGNRNPFIDNPKYANQLWEHKC